MKTRIEIESVTVTKLILLLSVGFLIVPPVARSQTTPEATSIPKQIDLVKQLDVATARSEGELKKGEESLRAINVPRIGEQQTVTVGFDWNEVQTTLKKARTSLIKSLNKSELLPLRNYVELNYPSPELRVLGFKGEVLLASKATTQEAFKDVKDFLDTLHKFESLTTDLEVRSSEASAFVDIWPDGKSPRTKTTDTSYKGLFRGHYNYKIYKDGFRPASGTFNTIKENLVVLICTLVSTSDSGSSTCLQK